MKFSQQDIQRALMGLSPENQERFFRERDEFLTGTPFTEPLFADFDHYRTFAGANTNEIVLGITAAAFEELFFAQCFEQYSLGGMVSICQASENLTFAMYLRMYGGSEGIVARWHAWRKDMERITAAVNALMEPAMAGMLRRITRIQQQIIREHGGPGNIHLPAN